MEGRPLDDAELVEQAKDGESRAYEELVQIGFGALGDRLIHHVTFPARYVGRITPNRGPEAGAASGRSCPEPARGPPVQVDR